VTSASSSKVTALRSGTQAALDRCEAVDLAPADLEPGAVRDAQAQAQRRQRAEPRIDRRTAPEAHQHVARPGGHDRQQQLADAVGGGDHGRSRRRRHQLQPACSGRGDHGGLVTAQQRTGLHGPSQRPHHLQVQPAVLLGGDHLAQAVTAIGQRQEVQHVVGPCAAPAGRDRCRRCRRGERALEAVRGDEDAHRGSLLRRPAPTPASAVTSRDATAVASRRRRRAVARRAPGAGRGRAPRPRRRR
jgi:hypothetical protein